MNGRKFVEKNWLYQKYIIEELSTYQIAQICGMKSHVTIWNWLKKFNIKTRASGGTLLTMKGKKHTKETKDKMSKKAKLRIGEKHTQWKGGKQTFHYGQARRVWEEYWREEVPDGYVIHHVDRDITNNNICNLALLTRSYHTKMHKRDGGGYAQRV